MPIKIVSFSIEYMACTASLPHTHRVTAPVHLISAYRSPVNAATVSNAYCTLKKLAVPDDFETNVTL